MQGFKIAIGGKGGVGKTTICAGLAQEFAESGFDVLAIDADPNTSLASAFGIPNEQSPVPLIEMKEMIAERIGSTKDAVGTYFRLNPKVSDLPERYWLKITCPERGFPPCGGPSRRDRLKLLVLGAITHGGGGCACPEGAFLKALLAYAILQRQELVLVDLAAGVEFMGRASVQGIDAMIVVVEPGARSIETANNLAKMAVELGIKNVAAIGNKVIDSVEADAIKSQLKDITLIGILPYSRSIQQADLRRTAVSTADVEFMRQIGKIKDALLDLISSNIVS